MVSSTCRFKRLRQDIIRRYANADNIAGLTQVLTTLAPLAFLWWARC